jgi:hypothetical protein
MLSPWIIRTLTLPPLLAFLVPRNFHRYHTPTIYLPQNSHHTYLLWHFHSHSEIYCHATFHHSIYYDTHHHCHIAFHDHVVDIVFVAKPPFIIFSYMSLLIHCTSWYTAGGIHIESYSLFISHAAPPRTPPKNTHEPTHYLSHTNPRRWCTYTKRIGARTHALCPATPARVHGGAHFCTKWQPTC